MKCIHLDFHTSPLIENIGRDFNREDYIRVIKDVTGDVNYKNYYLAKSQKY